MKIIKDTNFTIPDMFSFKESKTKILSGSFSTGASKSTSKLVSITQPAAKYSSDVLCESHNKSVTVNG